MPTSQHLCFRSKVEFKKSVLIKKYLKQMIFTTFLRFDIFSYTQSRLSNNHITKSRT